MCQANKINNETNGLFWKEARIKFRNTIKEWISMQIKQMRTFPGQNDHFPGQSIQDLKVINQDLCEKAYYIYPMFD